MLKDHLPLAIDLTLVARRERADGSVITPSIPWMIPLDARMLGLMTFCPPTITSPLVVLSIFSMVPPRVVISTGSVNPSKAAAV